MPGVTPAQLHSTLVSASVATIVVSSGTSSSTVSASSTLMVLAGAYWPYSLRAASTAPVSISARIQAWAGPSGMGTEPGGCTTPAGTADATAVPPATRHSVVAMQTRNFRMTAEPIASRGMTGDRVQSMHAEPGRDIGSFRDTAAADRLLDGHRPTTVRRSGRGVHAGCLH